MLPQLFDGADSARTEQNSMSCVGSTSPRENGRFRVVFARRIRRGRLRAVRRSNLHLHVSRQAAREAPQRALLQARCPLHVSPLSSHYEAIQGPCEKLVGPHLTEENSLELLECACGKSRHSRSPAIGFPGVPGPRRLRSSLGSRVGTRRGAAVASAPSHSVARGMPRTRCEARRG